MGAFEGGAWPSCWRGGGPVLLGLQSRTLKQPETRLWPTTALLLTLGPAGSMCDRGRGWHQGFRSTLGPPGWWDLRPC